MKYVYIHKTIVYISVYIYMYTYIHIYIFMSCNLLTLRCGTSNTNSPRVGDSG